MSRLWRNFWIEIRNLNWKSEQLDHQLDKLNFSLSGTVGKDYSVNLDRLDLVLQNAAKNLAEFNLAGKWDKTAGKSTFTVKAEKISPELYRWYSREELPELPEIFTKIQGKLCLNGDFEQESRIMNISFVSAEVPLTPNSALKLSTAPFSIDFTSEKMLENIKLEYM